MAAQKPTSKGQAWFCATGLPTDTIIQVVDMTFHLHKFPLMSKSRLLHQLITEEEERKHSRINRTQCPCESSQIEIIDDSDYQDVDEEECHIVFPDFPGGSDSFEIAAKFCYGVKIDLSASNVAGLLCAAEYLGMTEEYSEGNLVSKAERFLSQAVFKSISHSLRTLISCEKVLPMGQNLGIVQRCVEAIATRAAAEDQSLFGWPVCDGAGIDEANGRKRFGRGAAASSVVMSSWMDEVGLLSLPIFRRLIFAMKSFHLRSEVIESCLILYAKKCIPGILRTYRKPSAATGPSSRVPTENEQRALLETIISNLPIDKTLNSSPKTTRFLFGLLRTAYLLNMPETCRLTLEKRIGWQLEQATLDDLLIPSYSYLNETLYDVDCVEKIMQHFLYGIKERDGRLDDANTTTTTTTKSAALVTVGKLIDGYLSEIASDVNLKPEKFYTFAVALPDNARIFDDGIYRAVDIYLKAHPWTSDGDREKICSSIDCQKLTLEACTHAAQNERLPLRAVVQVLFFEQLQLRHAITGTLIAADEGNSEASGQPPRQDGEANVVEHAAAAVAPEERSTWKTAARENQVLRGNMDRMRTRVHELEREYSTMKKAIEKMEKAEPRRHVERGGWLARIGCKFKTQVCDSQEPRVAAARNGRSHRARR